MKSQWPLTIDHQNLINSLLSPSGRWYQIWSNSVKVVIRYHVNENGRDGHTVQYIHTNNPKHNASDHGSLAEDDHFSMLLISSMKMFGKQMKLFMLLLNCGNIGLSGHAHRWSHTCRLKWSGLHKKSTGMVMVRMTHTAMLALLFTFPAVILTTWKHRLTAGIRDFKGFEAISAMDSETLFNARKLYLTKWTLDTRGHTGV